MSYNPLSAMPTTAPPAPDYPQAAPLIHTRARRPARGPLIPHVNPMTCAWATPPTCISRGLRAHQGVNAHVQRLTRGQHTPRETHLCPKRRPPRSQPPVFSIFRLGGLQFGHHTTSNHDLTATKRGNCTIRSTTRRRHADSQLLMLQNPHQPYINTPTRPHNRTKII